MDWTRAIDSYCERTDPSYWAEPINALTNLAFVLVAAILWRRTQGKIEGRLLSAILFVIGVGSWLFHTHATVWAAAADSLPILLFTLLYIYVSNRDFWALPPWLAALCAAAYIPFTMALTPVFASLPFFQISSFYWPLPVLIFAYAVGLRTRAPRTARNLAIGAAILSVSLTFRSLDLTLCNLVPFGTHFMWHILNALMLGWMIETWRRHVAGAPAM